MIYQVGNRVLRISEFGRIPDLDKHQCIISFYFSCIVCSMFPALLYWTRSFQVYVCANTFVNMFLSSMLKANECWPSRKTNEEKSRLVPSILILFIYYPSCPDVLNLPTESYIIDNDICPRHAFWLRLCTRLKPRLEIASLISSLIVIRHEEGYHLWALLKRHNLWWIRDGCRNDTTDAWRSIYSFW